MYGIYYWVAFALFQHPSSAGEGKQGGCLEQKY